MQQAYIQNPNRYTSFFQGLLLGQNAGIKDLQNNVRTDLTEENILAELLHSGMEVEYINDFAEGFIIAYYIGLDYGDTEVDWDVVDQYIESYYDILYQENRQHQAMENNPHRLSSFFYGLWLGKSVGAYDHHNNVRTDFTMDSIQREIDNSGRNVENMDDFVDGFLIAYFVGLDYGDVEVRYDVYEKYAQDYSKMLEEAEM